jgi:translation initiation factor 2B subunit (eIF-2B alpha/beta/delta family)
MLSNIKAMDLHKIFNDNISGSSEIARKIIDWLKSLSLSESGNALPGLLKAMESLEKKFQHFSAVRHLIRAVRQHINAIYSDPDVRLSSLSKFLEEYRKTWDANQRSAAERIIKEIDFNNKAVLLHSHSRSLVMLFELLAQKRVPAEIIQTVSAPGKEGIVQAENLAKKGFTVKLINEAAASRFITDVDMFICGADAVYPEIIVNKTGTMMLALLCRHFRKNFYVLTDSRKFIDKEVVVPFCLEKFREATKPPAEILQNPPPGIIPVNYYFEPVPRIYVDCLFTE